MRDRTEGVLADAAPSDREAASAALHALFGELDRWDVALRGAASGPLTLAVTLLLAASVVVGVGLPALSGLPNGAASPLPLASGSVVSVALLVLLAQAVWWRSRLPFLATGWRRLDGYALLESTRVLVAAGASLPAALHASSAWCGEPSAGRALARALESGGGADAGPLLTSFETGLFLNAARSGLALSALKALTESRRLALRREIPREAARIHLYGLVLAAAGILLVAGSWMWTYASSLAA